MNAVSTRPAREVARCAAGIEALDYARRPPPRSDGSSHHKEWHHFVVLGAGVDLLVNFSTCAEGLGAGNTAETARIVLLVRTGTGGWRGCVESFAPGRVRVAAGTIDFDFAGNILRWHGSRFALAVALAAPRLRLELTLTPVTMPAFSPNIPMLDGPPLHWVVVPRLDVVGWLEVDDTRIDLSGTRAYHDHNWGEFRWGHDVAWEWGFVLPDTADVPWTVTFVRLTNRARTMVLEHRCLLWKGTELVRIFREPDLVAGPSAAFLDPATIFRIPPPMALLVPERAVDVPAAFRCRADDGPDWLDCAWQGEALAQVLIPSETGLGVTIFNEVLARCDVRGQLGREPIAFTGRSVMEFIRVC